MSQISIWILLLCYRKDGFVYQYYEALEQDLEGSLEIDTSQTDTTETMSVVDGICQDFFEFRMVSKE